MSEAYARLEPTLIPMLRPLARRARGRMMLTRIEPGCDGRDLRIFECSECGQRLQGTGRGCDQIGQVAAERSPGATVASLKRLPVLEYCNFQL